MDALPPFRPGHPRRNGLTLNTDVDPAPSSLGATFDPSPNAASTASIPQQHPSSPLNPDSNLHPIPITRRLSANGFALARKSLTLNSPNIPTRFISRTPLSFLSNSPSAASHASGLSSDSSVGWQLLTPTTTASSSFDLPMPSPAELPPANLALAHHLKSNAFHSTIKIPSSTSSSFGGSAGSPSFGVLRHGAPSPLDKLGYLQSIPPSPPISIPSADLLEMRPNIRTNVAIQHSIASPFVNLHSSPSPRSAVYGAIAAESPLTSVRRRQSAGRRGSALARELNHLDLTNDESGYDADHSLNGRSAAVHVDTTIPSPAPASRT